MNRIEPEEFVHLAEDLRVGHQLRAKHCGNSESMVISREPGKLVAHCFRCDGNGYVAEQESPANMLARVKAEHAADAEARRSVQLPDTKVYDLKLWPKDAGLWLFRAGFSPSMIEELGAYWCPELGRVVLPVMEDGHVIFWQARSVKRQPKIISPDAPRAGLVARYGLGKGDRIVLCEDILSAFKVGQEVEAWSLLGTKLLPGPFADLLRADKPVVVWLDGDDPGQISAAKILKKLRAFSIPVTNIVTEDDPKLQSRDTIRRLLDGE